MVMWKGCRFMKKKFLALAMSMVLAAAALTGCGSAARTETSEITTEAATEATTADATVADATTADATASDATTLDASATDAVEATVVGNGEVRVGALKGPTTMGLVDLMSRTEEDANAAYTFTMSSQPTDIVSGIASGKLDIALVPANLASTLWNKTKGGVSVIDVNTLGVLYCVTGDDSIKSVADLDGKTILSTGQGASPEYVLNYLLEKNGVNATVEFKSEATEVAAALATDPTQIAVLPQPFVTVAEGKNDALHTAFSLTDEWAKVSDSQLLTGVTVVRNDFLAENKEAVDQFLADHASSVEAVNGDAEAASKLIAQYGIIEKAPIAQKALPQCNIVCITGEEMKADLSAYLQVLYDADPSSVGGSLPDDAFYYAQ